MLLEKLLMADLVKKFLFFFGIGRFITPYL
jgi:hypothetical protein